MSTKKQRKKILEAVKGGTDLIEACKDQGIEPGGGRVEIIRNLITKENGEDWPGYKVMFPMIGRRIERCQDKDLCDVIIAALETHLKNAKTKKESL